MRGTVSISDIIVCIRAIWKKKWMVIVAMIVGLLLGILIQADNKNDTYRATTTIYSSTYKSYTESMVGTSTMMSYASVIKSNKVCERALTMLERYSLDVESVLDMMEVSYDSEVSPIITITVTSEDGQKCVDVANAVASAFVIEMQGITSEQNVQVLDEAKGFELVRTAPVQLILMCGIMMILAGGAVAGCIFVYEFFQTRLRTVEQISEIVDVKVIGIIPEYSK